MTKPKRLLRAILPLFFLVALFPSFVRAYKCAGASDAPNYLDGDILLFSLMAYDLKIPYTSNSLIQWAEPMIGDVVLFAMPGSGAEVFKTIVAGPNDTIEMRSNHVLVNNVEFDYQSVEAADFHWVPSATMLGTTIEKEAHGGVGNFITYTDRASAHASFAPLEVPAGHYYVLGSNRDHSLDSRSFGCVPRESIRGKLLGVLISSAKR